MRRSSSLVGALILGVALTASAGAQSQPAQNQQAGSQVSSENLTPQAQAKLVQEILHQLRMIPYYGVFDNLNFQLQGRTVILGGTVTRSIMKPDAENAVKKIEGVEKVVNNIKVLPPSPMDQQVREQVYNSIYNYGPLFKYKNLPIPPIRIIVQGAKVTLEGVVDTETDKNLCTQRVNQVSSVISVTNNLRVVPPQSAQKPK